MRANPPRLDPGGQVVGEDAPRWIAAAAALMGVLLIAAGVWALNGSGEDPVASAAPGPTGSAPTVTTLAIPSGTAGAAPKAAVTTRPATIASAPIAPEPTPATPLPVPVSATSAATTVVAPATTIAAPAFDCPAAIAVWFPSGSSVPLLDPAALRSIVTWLLERPAASVVVQGHASAIGDDQANLLLSYQRAKSVSATLGALGVPAGKIVVRAAGALEPVAENPADPVNQQVRIEPAPAVCGAS